MAGAVIVQPTHPGAWYEAYFSPVLDLPPGFEVFAACPDAGGFIIHRKP